MIGISWFPFNSHLREKTQEKILLQSFEKKRYDILKSSIESEIFLNFFLSFFMQISYSGDQKQCEMEKMSHFTSLLPYTKKKQGSSKKFLLQKFTVKVNI